MMKQMSPRERLGLYLLTPDGQRILELLDALYPERTPDIGADPRVIDADAGRRDVVRTCFKLKDDAERNVLNKASI